MDIHDLASAAAETVMNARQAGRDEMAQVLADFLANHLGDYSQHYLDGYEDALITLRQHGATDPR